MKYNLPTKSQLRNDKILRLCKLSKKTAIDIADAIELGESYTVKILNELIRRDKMFKITTKFGVYYKSQRWMWDFE
jgi:hypothetical protein